MSDTGRRLARGTSNRHSASITARFISAQCKGRAARTSNHSVTRWYQRRRRYDTHAVTRLLPTSADGAPRSIQQQDVRYNATRTIHRPYIQFRSSNTAAYRKTDDKCEKLTRLSIRTSTSPNTSVRRSVFVRQSVARRSQFDCSSCFALSAGRRLCDLAPFGFQSPMPRLHTCGRPEAAAAEFASRSVSNSTTFGQ